MTLMESLPPMDWNELATKSDLAALDERMTARFEAVDARVGEGLAEVRGEMSAMNARIDARFEVVDARFEAVGARVGEGLAEVRGETKEEFGVVHREFGRLHRDFARQTYVILVGIAAAFTPIYLALFAGLGG